MICKEIQHLAGMSTTQCSLFDEPEIPNLRDAKVKSFRVVPASRSEVASFVERNHYSGSINGVISDYCFRLCWGNHVIGAAIFGRLAMANQWKRFSDDAADVIELRRLCCIDDTPKNTESFLIGRSLRWLAQHTPHKIVVSYADAEYGHTGTIYRASNFEYLGLSAGVKVILFEGKRYHDKALRTMHEGQVKPFGKRLAVALESGEAQWKETAGKHTFIYKLRK